MKKNLLLLLIVAAQVSYTHAQCDKEISTNPFNPFNEEFLPLKNIWYPSLDPSIQAYTVNSFVNNTINWYPGNGIQLDLNAGWTHPFGGAIAFQMVNPFANNNFQTHLFYPSDDENERDFRWEDGWELLWMNTGKSPNGDSYSAPSPGTYFAHGNQNTTTAPFAVVADGISPSNVPYFALYNRYRGMIRLFANVWRGGNTSNDAQQWAVTMRYTIDSEDDKNISGLLRHASSIDRALDQPTEHIEIIGPRTQMINKSNWSVAEFPMAFDPCICMKERIGFKNPGRVEFVFEIIETTAIDLYSRSMEVEQEITASTLNEDFLNLSETDEVDFKPGTATYRHMDDMFSKYQDQLLQYNNAMNDYNSARNSAKSQLLNIAKNFVTSGINLVIPAGGLFLEVLDGDAFKGVDNANKITNDAIKGLIGSGVDYASMEIFGKQPDKPIKPAAPTASFRETSYRGKLTRTTHESSPALFIPGGINADFVPSSLDLNLSSTPTQIGYGKAQLYTSIFPAYNKVLGTSALLRTPESTFHYNSNVVQNILYLEETAYQNGPVNEPDPVEYECDITKEIVGNTDFKLKLNDLQMALNRSLDFNIEKTKTYVRIEVQMRNKVPPVDLWLLGNHPEETELTTNISASNFHLSHEFPVENEGTRRIYNSKWIPLDEVNQYIFSLNVQDKAYYSLFAISSYPGSCELISPFNPDFIGQELESVKMKILQDNYFQQIGYLGEDVNTTQVTTYYLYSAEENINHLGDLSNWSDAETGVFDHYIPGLITLGNETITTSHPFVHEVIGNEIFINAQEVNITGSLQVQSGYTVVIQSLMEIQLLPGASFNPKIHMRIKKDFYDTPVFEYTDNAKVYNFCNNSSAYQANTPSTALSRRIEDAIAAQEPDALGKANTASASTLALYPNPARSELTIQTQGAGIDRLSIFDMASRPVMQASPGGASLYRMDISGLAQGVYIVRAECGGEVLTEKLVVAK